MITVLAHGRLLDCLGNEPIEDVSIVIEKGEIKDIYSGHKPQPEGAMVINIGGRTILPGFSDAHCHSTFTDHLPRMFNTPPIIAAARIMQNLHLDLQAGFTTLCDKTGANWALKHAIEEGLIKSPRLLISCSMISKTDGHWDFSNFRNGLGELVIKDTGLVAIPRIADGVDDCRKAER